MFFQVQQTSVDDESIARAIAQKLGDTPGVSYSEVANRAIECGRTELAIRVRLPVLTESLIVARNNTSVIFYVCMSEGYQFEFCFPSIFFSS